MSPTLRIRAKLTHHGVNVVLALSLTALGAGRLIAHPGGLEKLRVRAFALIFVLGLGVHGIVFRPVGGCGSGVGNLVWGLVMLFWRLIFRSCDQDSVVP